LTHQACHTFLATCNTGLTQVTVNAWAAVDTQTVLKGLFDV
jgi:hypothetical protein